MASMALLSERHSTSSIKDAPSRESDEAYYRRATIELVDQFNGALAANPPKYQRKPRQR